VQDVEAQKWTVCA